MDRENIINEGLFDKLKQLVKDRKLKKTISKDKKFKSALNNINKNFQDLEDLLNSLPGPKVKAQKMTVDDFLK